MPVADAMGGLRAAPGAREGYGWVGRAWEKRQWLPSGSAATYTTLPGNGWGSSMMVAPDALAWA